MRWGRMLLAAVAAGAMGIGAAAFAEQTSGKRTAADVAALNADQIVAAVQENLGFLVLYTNEAHRRYPKIPLVDGVAAPAIDARSQAQLRALPDQKILDGVQRLSDENDRLIARYKVLRPEDRDPDESEAPASRPAPAAKADGDYCYKMYGQAYSLCASDDRSCKMIAANDQAICNKTGRWP